MSCREVHFHKVDNCLIIYSQHTVPGVYRIRMYNLKTPSLKMSLVFVARHCCRHRISISHHQVHTHCYENSTVESDSRMRNEDVNHVGYACNSVCCPKTAFYKCGADVRMCKNINVRAPPM